MIAGHGFSPVSHGARGIDLLGLLESISRIRKLETVQQQESLQKGRLRLLRSTDVKRQLTQGGRLLPTHGTGGQEKGGK